jgi:hypothetical protein
MGAKKFIVSGLVAGLVIFIVSMLFSTVFQALFNYDVLKLEGMRSVNDPIMILFFIHPWVLGFALVLAYSIFRDCFKGKNWEKAKKFGTAMWVVVTIPSAFMVFSSMNYPLGFTFCSLIGGLVYMILGAYAIVKFYR